MTRNGGAAEQAEVDEANSEAIENMKIKAVSPKEQAARANHDRS
jgi:hypothetical protein